MAKELAVNERLIVAADFLPKDHGGIDGVANRVIQLGNELDGSGVYIKVNSILRAFGYDLVNHLHDMGLKVFTDLKLTDIPNTLATDAALLKEVKPDMLTVMCNSGIDAMKRVQDVLGEFTKVLGVTILTSLDEEDCQAIYGCSTKAGVLRFARMAEIAGVEGLILSPKEVEVLTKHNEITLSLNTPGIRPEWSVVKGDDQSRVMTPLKAIQQGSDRLVVGRPIVQAAPNDEGKPQSPREAVEKTLEEIKVGLERKE